jgi:alpha-glucosidase
MLATLMYLQKGIPFILNGEEIGMKNLEIKAIENFFAPEAQLFYEKAYDLGYRSDYILKELNATSKDASRGVMQWDESAFAGFSSAFPWSGVNIEPDYTVAKQEEDEDSILNYYRKLLSYKKMFLFTEGSFKLIETNDNLYCYERKLGQQTAIICCNLTDQALSYNDERFSKETVKVLLTNGDNALEDRQCKLAAYGSLVLLIDKENENKLTAEDRINVI